MERDSLSTDDLDRETVAAARRRSPPDRMRDGLQLFDRTTRIMAAGIRHEQPDADSAAVLRVLRARLRLAKALETR